jgi:hypothetical protein
MLHKVASEENLAAIEKRAVSASGNPLPKVLGVRELLALDVSEARMLIDGVIPAAGASLIVGAAKCGKTLNAVQIAIAVASGEALYGNYRVLESGPTLIVEQDDPAGAASMKTILQCSNIDTLSLPFHFVGPVPYTFGEEFLAWLDGQIVERKLRLVVLDSYTALRDSRPRGGDIVKSEQSDLTQMDALAKRTNCALLIIHHSSKGSSGLDWSEKAAGTFAMSAATESQLFISRFSELDAAAPERLVRIRARHSEDLEMVLRFQKETLNFDFVLAGGAAPIYPTLLQLKSVFGQEAFSPRDLTMATGASRATATRTIERLYRANAIRKITFGQWALIA